MSKCRTEVVVPNLEPILAVLGDLNTKLKYYFVLVENGRVIVERVSLIQGEPTDINEEKVFILNYLKEIK